jgi:hypothetical protein
MTLTNSDSQYWRSKAVELGDQLRQARTALHNDETHFTQLAAASHVDASVTAEQVAKAKAKRDAARDHVETLQAAVTMASDRASAAELEERRDNTAEAMRQAEQLGEKHRKKFAEAVKALEKFAACVEAERDLAKQLEAVSPVVASRPDIFGQLCGFPGSNKMGQLTQLYLPLLFDLTRYGTGIDLKATRAAIVGDLVDLSRCMSVPGHQPGAPAPIPDLVIAPTPEPSGSSDGEPQAAGKFHGRRVIDDRPANYLDFDSDD